LLGVIFLQGLLGTSMIKKLNEPNIVHRKVTKKGTKTETLEALNELGWILQNLVNQQSLMSQLKLESFRLKHYDESLVVLVEAFENLANLLQVKQAGGRKSNSNFSLAYSLVKDHYIEKNKVMSAKALVKAVNNKLSNQNENADEQGNEPFSERLAGDCIRIFKICLPHEKF
jgi:hypothetical protein